MATSLNQPQAISQPFAQNGDKNVIPVTNDGTTGAASESLGFPQITSVPVAQGGIPPARKDFNGIFNVLSNQYFYLQNGGSFTFNQDVSDAIGGYPVDAILQYTDTVNNMSYQVRSLIPNNTYNFVITPSYIDGEHWAKAFSEDLSDYVHKTGSNTISANNTFSGTNTFSGSTSLSTNTTGVTQATNDASTKIATTQFVQNVAVTKANKDMDNLTSTGQNIANWSTNVTNCITEIPQDIKLELNNGTLKLKAESKGYMGNGTVRTITGEPTLKNTGSAQMFLHITSGGTGLYAGYMTGGTVSERPSSPITYATYYNTNTQKCEYYNGSTWNEISLPIAIVTRGADGFTSIDQVFNGFGYIGSTVFALPGVKGLIPNGRNADGSLKSIPFEISNVITYGRNLNQQSVPLWYDGTNLLFSRGISYDEKLNIVGSGEIPRGQVATADLSSGVISNLTPKTAFHAVDYNDFSNLSDTVDTNTSNITTLQNTKQDVATAVNYDNITNCITEIPQDIKLELNNGTLTLKAGSKVYVPNGAGVFDTITTTQDLTITYSGSDTMLVFLRKNGSGLSLGSVGTAVSGSTDSLAGTTYHNWYDTTNNVIHRYTNDASVPNHDCSLPLCIVKSSGGAITSINQVFNGFGYIGSTVFALPGVKGLIPNGRNADGSLKNIEFTTSGVVTYNVAASRNNVPVYIKYVGGIDYYTQGKYHEDINMNESYDGNYFLAFECGKLTSDSTSKITSFTPKTAFHAVDYNDFAPVKAQVDTKLDKVTEATTVMQAYVKNANGTQNMANIVQNSASASSLVIRTSTGTIKTATPEADDDAVNLSYINDKFQVVASLPATPDPDTFYFIPE